MEQFKNWHPTEQLKNSNSESSAPAVGNLATASKFFQGEPAEIGIAAELWTLSAVRCESPMNCISFRFLIVLRRALPLALFLLQPQPCESAPAEQITNEFSGNQTDGLKPVLFVNSETKDWIIFLQFVPITNFAYHSWLATANPFGAKLQLCSTNGEQIRPSNPTVSDAINLPFFTTVSNALHTISPSRRYGQWPRGEAGHRFQTSGFSLRSAFDISFTNDLFLQVTPVMYKENTNNLTAWLVEFQPIRVKLKADGTVQKLE